MKISPLQLARKSVFVWSLGTLEYWLAHRIQQLLAKEHLRSNKITENVDTLLLVEHKPVYTIGIRTSGYSAVDEDKLRKYGADFQKTDRGGLITFHGPGQMVVYPILNLNNFNRSAKWYVCQLEETVIHMSKIGYGISAHRTSDTGIWFGDKKLCALGVHVKRYITTHGLALNCDVDLEWFSHIVPCGISNKGVTSLSQILNKKISIQDVVNPLLHSFSFTFDCHVQNADPSLKERIVELLKIEHQLDSEKESQLIIGNTWVEEYL